MSKPPAQAQEAVAAPNASSLARADVKAIIAAVPKHKAPSWPQPDLSCHESAGRPSMLPCSLTGPSSMTQPQSGRGTALRWLELSWQGGLTALPTRGSTPRHSHKQ